MQITELKDRRSMYHGKGKRIPLVQPIPFNHTHSFTGAEFKIYKTPVVYAWMRGKRWLYIGHSYRGLQRIVDSKHHALHESEMEDSDKILMMYNLTVQQAKILETDLIRRYTPKYNKIKP